MFSVFHVFRVADKKNKTRIIPLTPFISSDEDGNVTVEWCGEGRRLHIQIGETVAEYIQV